MSIRDDYLEYCNQAPMRESSTEPTPVPKEERPLAGLYIVEVLKVKMDTDKALLVQVKAGLFWVPKSVSYLATDKKSIALESWFEVRILEEEEK